MNAPGTIIECQVAYTTMFDVCSFHTPHMRNVLKHGSSVVENLEKQANSRGEFKLVWLFSVILKKIFTFFSRSDIEQGSHGSKVTKFTNFQGPLKTKSIFDKPCEPY